MAWLLYLTALSLFSLAVSQNPFFTGEYRRMTRQNGPPCLTPDNKPGVCINIKQCPQLLTSLQTQFRNPDVVSFLRSSKCNNEVPSDVCCPNNQVSQPSAPNEEFANLPSPPACGKSYASQQTRIVGGQPAEKGAWPWLVLIGYLITRRGKTEGPLWQCGGSIITDQWVLTAAHCINPGASLQLAFVLAGKYEIDNDNDGSSPIQVPVEKKFAHENYVKGKKTDDIGLVKLRFPLTYNTFIQPICLPKSPSMRAMSFARYFPFVAGWGATSGGGPASTKPLQVQVPVVDNRVCNNAYEPLGATIINTQLCAGYEDGGKDACQGDSGGPLMLPNGTTYILIGIVSFGYKCAQRGYPGVYTRVTSYVPWISRHIS